MQIEAMGNILQLLFIMLSQLTLLLLSLSLLKFLQIHPKTPALSKTLILNEVQARREMCEIAACPMQQLEAQRRTTHISTRPDRASKIHRNSQADRNQESVETRTTYHESWKKPRSDSLI